MARVFALVSGGLAALFLVSVVAVTSSLQKSTLTWPVAAPTRLPTETADGATPYTAIGWTVTSPFGWRANPADPATYDLHEGIDLSGPMFCPGCQVPPLGDVVVTHVGWDQPGDSDPLHAGLGVVVDMALQHPEEAGNVTVRYGHLQPYRVHVRTQSCQQQVSCPDYESDGAATVEITCAGPLAEISRGGGQASYAYATPGPCTAAVMWPAPYEVEGDTLVTFDQQIVPGTVSSDAAITFRAHLPPPPPALTPTLTLPTPLP